MKFLVTTTPRRLQMPPVALMEAAKAWISARLADKTMDCCYGFVTGGGVCIMNAGSAEKVAQFLMEYPAYMGADWKVDPLCDINESLDQITAMIKRAAG
jgi:hypothetical protein